MLLHQVKEAKASITKIGEWNLLDWQTLIAELPSLSKDFANDDLPLVVASSTLGGFLLVTFCCPRLIRSLSLSLSLCLLLVLG